ncbi:hypothetical protein [Arthrobacter silvisoli]|uniref:hypothetical protein n=1 Tax=Arthrobacter silvisoli TaxID=2291022 RepID=UPI000E218647|nr:hypothetical protein [Arthrobacter silvisoli]
MIRNTHIEEALDNIRGAEEVHGHEPEDRMVLAQIAQTQATLALAHEQRTANMIAAFTAMEDSQGATFLGDQLSGAKLANLIVERLGE